ncbi:siderophore-interacting protein [Herbaspirillum aquaticum]|uniref:siderophore-interacting protein n=2 Tax=Herbaspirillum TaxID=963 RepID=UPI0024DE09AB|nr:siderophore-interacting protein [Herbaspirillum aquaticum]
MPSTANRQEIQDIRQEAPADGAFTRMLKRFLLKQATISSVERLGAQYVRIRLQGDALKHQTWTPGDKIQVSLGRGFENRTYTPVSWDSAQGCAEFIVYLHGGTATCAFFDSVQPGAPLSFMGPRGSLEVNRLQQPQLFGDETCLGLAAALVQAQPHAGAALIFEVDDIAQTSQVLQALGLRDAMVVGRLSGDVHLAQVSEAILRAALPDTDFILAGRAAAIQAIKRRLNGAGVSNRSIKAKAYWAAGKRGLD